MQLLPGGDAKRAEHDSHDVHGLLRTSLFVRLRERRKLRCSSNETSSGSHYIQQHATMCRGANHRTMKIGENPERKTQLVLHARRNMTTLDLC